MYECDILFTYLVNLFGRCKGCSTVEATTNGDENLNGVWH